MMGARQSTTTAASNDNSPSRIINQSDDNNSPSNMGNNSSTYSTPYRNGHRSNTENNDDIFNHSDSNHSSRQRTRSLVLSGGSASDHITTTSGNSRRSSSRPSHSSAIDFLTSNNTSSSSSSHDILSNDLDIDIDVKCSGCSKIILKDELQFHLMCYKLPFNYNEDVLTEDKGECVICLEDMLNGEKIARLPCLCIYHKKCIDAWFNVNRSCPEHPTITV
uniref:E3 ubiquitin-protein ligase ZNRF1 n=1 Tax=Dermatophagoides pteronyssinus TaxID=6956 RepID=A0A6P6Y931_DERPT|nr:E3 ubiquitin-protein ligase ZNRF1-like isoform X2 [Dermatophagoides pteronyssinus]